MDARTLELLVQSAHDGTISPADWERLQTCLAEDERALDLYLSYGGLTGGLNTLPRGQSAPASGDAAWWAGGLLDSRGRGAWRMEKAKMARWALASVAVAVAGFFALAQWVRVEPSGPLAGFVLSEGAEVRVFHPEDKHRYASDRLVAGSRIEVRQGVLELRLQDGGRAWFDAPSGFSLSEANRVHLLHGSAGFQAGENRDPLTVVTGSFEVVDIGTRFGVTAAGDAGDLVRVEEGLVRVDFAPHVEAEERSRLIAVGEGVRVGSERRALALTSGIPAFRFELPPALPSHRLDFDTIVDGSFVLRAENSSGGDYLVTSEGGLDVDGFLTDGIAGGRALAVRGRPLALASGWQGILGDRPRTVSLWMRLPVGHQPDYAPAMVMWGHAGPEFSHLNPKFKVAVAACESDAGRPAVLRISFGQLLLAGSTPLADGQWRHVAVVFRGHDSIGRPRIEAWIDGQRESLADISRHITSLTPVETLPTPGEGLLIGRYELRPTGPAGTYFGGDLDQIEIFHGALRASAIRTLAAQGDE